MPTTTVIIIFHNEALSTLLRTVTSVLNTSPAHLLEEVSFFKSIAGACVLALTICLLQHPQILLVDDASTGDWLGEKLDEEVAKLAKTRILRLPTRSGLIRAKVAGAHAAKGEVLTFLDR